MGASPDNAILGSSPNRMGRIAGSSPLGTSAPIPQFQHPSHELLDKNGFQQMKYDKWRSRCLEERAQSGAQLSHLSTLCAPVKMLLLPAVGPHCIVVAFGSLQYYGSRDYFYEASDKSHGHPD